jgi:hypothetical protein
VFFGIDHLVLCGTRDDHRRLAERLGRSGFSTVPNPFRFDDIGAHSRSLAFRDGAYVEVVYEVAPGAPAVWFGGAVPRVMGIGVSSDDFERDTAGWEWHMDETLTLDDGTAHRIVGAGPHEHLSELYVFAMDRPDRTLDWPEIAGTPQLQAITFAGAASGQWQESFGRWFGSSQALGDVELRFEDGSQAGVAVSLEFAVDAEPGSVPLAQGSIQLASSG